MEGGRENEGKSRRWMREGASHDSGFVFQLLNIIFVIVNVFY